MRRQKRFGKKREPHRKPGGEPGPSESRRGAAQFVVAFASNRLIDNVSADGCALLDLLFLAALAHFAGEPFLQRRFGLMFYGHGKTLFAAARALSVGSGQTAEASIGESI